MITINRWYQPDCVLGRMEIAGFRCFTLELPWCDNYRQVSCIPEGIYTYESYVSPKHGQVLLLKDVPHRSMIEIHAGNYTRQIEGCILVGDSIKYLDGDKTPDITNSKATLKKVLELAGNVGQIEIKN